MRGNKQMLFIPNSVYVCYTKINLVMKNVKLNVFRLHFFEEKLSGLVSQLRHMFDAFKEDTFLSSVLKF